MQLKQERRELVMQERQAQALLNTENRSLFGAARAHRVNKYLDKGIDRPFAKLAATARVAIGFGPKANKKLGLITAPPTTSVYLPGEADKQRRHTIAERHARGVETARLQLASFTNDDKDALLSNNGLAKTRDGLDISKSRRNVEKDAEENFSPESIARHRLPAFEVRVELTMNPRGVASARNSMYSQQTKNSVDQEN